MRRLVVLAALALAGAVAVLTWAILAERGHEEGPPRALHSFGPIEVKANMPITQVAADSLGCSFTFRQAIWPGMGGSGGYHLDEGLSVTGFGGLASFTFRGAYDDFSHPGEWGLTVEVKGFGQWTTWYTPPTDPDDMYWVEVPCSAVVLGRALRCTSSTQPIGEKGATHAKEHIITEEWVLSPPSTLRISISGQTSDLVVSEPELSPLTLGIGGRGIDADDWSECLVGVKYAMSIEDICFCGNPINTTGYTARTWGDTAASVDKLWVEGFGGSSIGFWCSESFYNGAYVYNDYTGGTISAPLSYDFSPLSVKWMDGTDISSVEVYCTGLRTLSTQEDVDEGRADHVGQDIGPWHGTIGELKALGRVTQKYGCYYW